MKKTFWSLLLITFFLTATWFWVTQPIDKSQLTPRTDLVKIDPARLEKHVKMLSETIVPRSSYHIHNLDLTAGYIKHELEKAGGEIEVQKFTSHDLPYKNVIATFGPKTYQRIIIGAHYDVHGELPGADDNASGVAGLIELAYLLGQSELPMRVELAAYTLEEVPHFGDYEMGSARHARLLKEKQISVQLMISLEMIGYFSDKPGSQQYPASFFKAFYPDMGNFIAVVGKFDHGLITRDVKRTMQAQMELPVHSIAAPRFIDGIDRSDHSSFWDVGYPAIMITDTSFYRNHNYHTAGDTYDTLDYKKMAEVVKGVYAIVVKETNKK